MITITLLAFLVLLLVSLASLTRVETQVASNNQQIAQARQNALLALNIALGQLQKFTGPDQRTTARADMDAALANTKTANGRWLGAYGNSGVIDRSYSALRPSEMYDSSRDTPDSHGSYAKLLNWLVSGNENTLFNPASNVSAEGKITSAPSAFAYTPTSAVNLEAVKTLPVASDTQALLVGSNSVTAKSDYVSAPLVQINAAAGTIPGLASAAQVGRYAWWVGDEGAKARINLPMASATQASSAFVSAQRTAIELMDAKNEVGSTTDTDLIGTTAYDPTLAKLLDVVSPKQLSLLSATAGTDLPAAVKLRFHDLTGASSSVLADVYAGGLKKDLSAALATGSSSPADSSYLFTPENTLASDTFGVPTWGQLRSYAQTMSVSDQIPANKLVLSTPTKLGVAPVMTAHALGMKYVAPSGIGDGLPIRLAVFPMVVLWNPYTSTIPQHTYEVGFNRRFGSLLSTLEVEGPANTWTAKETISFVRNLRPTGGSAAYIRFKVQLPAGGIPPGQSLVFTLPTGGATYDTSLVGEPQQTLTNGFNAAGYVLAGSASFGVGEASKRFRANGMMQGGGISVYFGEVSSSSLTTDLYMAQSANNYRWYQYIAGLSPGSLFGSTNWQGPLVGDGSGGGTAFFNDPLVSGILYPTPALVCEFQMTFGLLPSGQVNYPNVRWIAQTNPRAVMFSGTAGGVNPLNLSASSGVQNWHPRTFDPGGKRASAGVSIESGSAIVDTTLFEFRPDTQPLLTLGQLQHANLSYHVGYPSYVIGNSLADFHFVGKRDKASFPYTMTSGTDNEPVTQMTSYYDISWLLNRNLWDRYFVSTVPHLGTGRGSDTNTTAIPVTQASPQPLSNPRHTLYISQADESLPTTQREANLRDVDRAAANLMVAGGFNINSTSEQAWRAVLGGVNQLAYDPVAMGTSSSKLAAAFPRFSRPLASSNVASAPYMGYRALNETQIAQLAKNIVTEVRNRGPFVSLADFVNRRLVDNSTTTVDERLKGVIQAALDATASGSGAANQPNAPFNDTPPYTNSAYGTKYDAELMQGGSGSVAPISSRASFAPQTVSQADVLSAIGAGLSARSDTFTVRTYGEAVNPVTQDIQGRAWCEAVVQRLPEYLEASATNAYDLPVTGSVNQQMGRRYKIVSFRWLTSNDI